MVISKQELVKRVVTLGLGLSFFGLVAAIHVISTTGAGSVSFLGVLWIFAPAPAVFLWSRLSRRKNWSGTQKTLSTGYLSLATLLALVVPAAVGWIATERALHPAVCEAGKRSLADYPDIQPSAELVSFPVPEGGLVHPGAKPSHYHTPSRLWLPTSGDAGVCPGIASSQLFNTTL
jgi:hypothetical protein